MNKPLLLTLIISLFITLSQSFSQTTIDPSDWPGMVGYWKFDNSSNIEEATIGNALELGGTQTYVTGASAGDGATRIGNDSYYKCTHDIAPNGGGSDVNEFTLMIDVKIPSSGQYYCFYQANTSNSNDGEVFINPNNHLGISDTYYTNYAITPGEWYRIVIAVDLGNTFRYYIDGHLVLDGTSQSIDGRFSLDPYFFWFRDDNDEDNEFDVSAAAIFNYTLSDSEAETLGGYGHYIPDVPIAGTDPYLQTPTPTSIYVSWHSTETSSTYVKYGTTASFGQQTNGTYEDISGKTWHTVKLENLTPNTVYYYKVFSGNDSSEVSSFKTLNVPTATGEHIRFLLLGDSRTDVYRTSEISQAAEQTLIDTYGDDWQNVINVVIHVGDIAESDNIDRYQNEFFTPYGNLSKKVPFMISVGNHEYNAGGASNYFKYMKFEDFTGAPYESTSSAFNEKFYKFQIGNVLFISLNSNDALAVQEQKDWLTAVLDAAEINDEIDFIFPFFHHPGHSEIWPDGNTDYVQDDILPILKNYSKVSMTSYGHSHAYERGVIELDTTNVNYRCDMHMMLNGGAGSALDRWGMYSNQQDYPEIHMTLDHYIYSVIDVDCDNKSWNCKTYSLGNLDKQLNNVLIDEWYSNINQAKPNTPVALDILNQGTSNVELLASNFSGVDSLMTSQFQLTTSPGDYSSPILDKTRDWQNIYGDSGAPDYNPIDLNAGIELNRLNVDGYVSGTTQIYGWRVRYRDFNLKWSEWSNEYIINNPDFADFIGTPLTICEGESVTFTDASTNSPADWSWDFGDGNSSTAQNPSHPYTTAGTYTVSLTVINAEGLTDTEIKTGYITVNPLPEVNVSASSEEICEGNPTVITATGADSYIWTPETNLDATTGAVVNATPTSDITYTVTGTTTAGCSASNNISITVNHTPIVGFTIDASGEPIINFTNTTTGADSYSWDLGDETTETTTDVSHEYTTNNTFTVTLSATNTCGTETSQQNVTITGIGIVSFNKESIKIFPNPAETILHVSLPIENAKIQLVNLDGKILKTKNSNHSETIDINMEDIPTGIYNLIITTKKDEQIIVKVIKK